MKAYLLQWKQKGLEPLINAERLVNPFLKWTKGINLRAESS